MIMVAKRGFGQIQRLPSKRYRARYTGPDGVAVQRAVDVRDAAGRRGVADRRTPTDRRRHLAAADGAGQAAAGAGCPAAAATTPRTGSLGRALKPRTREHYRRLLDRQILPPLGDLGLAAITPDVVRAWWVKLGDGTPTLRAHAYSLLRSILHDAVADGLITANPCHIRGAGNAKRVHRIKPASLAELEVLVGAMPRRYRAMVLLAAWCGLRFGELTELRRSDVDVANAVIHVRRGGGARRRRGHRRSAQERRRDPERGDPAAPDAIDHRTPGRQRQRPRRAAVPSRGRAVTPGTGDAVPGVLPGAGRRPADPTSGSTTFGTPARFSPPAPVRPWPNSWPDWDIRRQERPCATNTPPRTGTGSSPNGCRTWSDLPTDSPLRLRPSHSSSKVAS